MTNERWDPATCALVGAVVGPSALLVLWLSSMIPFPADALMEIVCFFGGAAAGAATFLGAALVRNAAAA